MNNIARLLLVGIFSSVVMVVGCADTVKKQEVASSKIESKTERSWKRVELFEGISFSIEIPDGAKKSKWESPKAGEFVSEHVGETLGILAFSYENTEDQKHRAIEQKVGDYPLDTISETKKNAFLEMEKSKLSEKYQNFHYEKLKNGHWMVLADAKDGQSSRISGLVKNRLIVIYIVAFKDSQEEYEKNVKQMLDSMIF